MGHDWLNYTDVSYLWRCHKPSNTTKLPQTCFWGLPPWTVQDTQRCKRQCKPLPCRGDAWVCSSTWTYPLFLNIPTELWFMGPQEARAKRTSETLWILVMVTVFLLNLSPSHSLSPSLPPLFYFFLSLSHVTVKIHTIDFRLYGLICTLIWVEVSLIIRS